MPTIKELQDQADDLQTALDEEQAQIKAAMDKQQAVIDELMAGGGSEAERQAVADKLSAIKADLLGTIADESPAPTN